MVVLRDPDELIEFARNQLNDDIRHKIKEEIEHATEYMFSKNK